jgi:hypothetical protein
MSLFEKTALVRYGGCESPALVSEQLALNKILRKGATVDRNESMPAAPAALVNRPGDQLLPAPGLTLYQYGTSGLRRGVDSRIQHSKGIAAPNKPGFDHDH